MLDSSINIYEAIGLLGAFLYVASYARLQFQRDFVKSFYYSFANFLASGFVLISLIQSWNLPSVIIQSIWLMISVFGIGRCYQYYKRGKRLTYKSLTPPESKDYTEAE